MSEPIAFLICTESGDLEDKSLLLVESIRRFGGSLQNVPIYSFQPREGKEISNYTLKQFRSRGVVHQKVILNRQYPDYPIANKILVSAHAEQSIDAKVLVFLDSDQVFFSEPTELLLEEDFEVGIRPVDRKHIGSIGNGDPQEAYWQKLYQFFGVDREIFVQTTLDKESIRGYWNSGMVAVQKKTGILSQWLQNFRLAMEKKLIPDSGIFHLDQLTLAATLCSMDVQISTLSPAYNYPFHRRSEFPETEKIKNFDEVVSIHYHWMFKEEDWKTALDDLEHFDNRSSRYRWLYRYLSKRTFRKNLQDYLDSPQATIFNFFGKKY